MRKLIPFMAVLMAVSLAYFSSACSNNSNRSSSNGTRTKMSNSDVEKAVKDRLNADPQLRASDIKVNADSKKNELKLSGTVNSEQARNQAIQIARSTLPGFAINDTIDVKPRSMARTPYDNQNENQGANERDNMNQQENQNPPDQNRTPAR